MKRVVTLAVLAAVVVSCSRSSESDVSIFGGKAVTEGDILKSTVSLRVGDEMHCSATIISESIAISAAHCITPKSIHSNGGDAAENRRFEKEANLAFGSKANKPVATRRVVATRVPKEWQAFADRYNDIMRNPSSATRSDVKFLEDKAKNGNWSDIAVVQFAGGIPSGFAAAKLADKHPDKNSKLMLAGFGLTKFDARDYGTLRAVDVKLKEASMHEREITTVGNRGSGSCKGDSGGPMLLKTETGFELLGASSRDTVPASCGKGNNVYTSVVGHMSFIRSSIQELNSIGIPEFQEESVESNSVPTGPFVFTADDAKVCSIAKDMEDLELKGAIVTMVCLQRASESHRAQCVTECGKLAGL